MLYGFYQTFEDMMRLPRRGAELAGAFRPLTGRWADGPVGRRAFAAARLLAGTKVTHKRPGYQIKPVATGNQIAPVFEEIALSKPYGDLLHFVKDGVEAPQPKVLVVAPLSGHYATLLRDTVQTMLRDHDVYITDWKNARDVAPSNGPFGFADYVDYLIAFLHHLGPGANVVGVCQPCVAALVAVAVMAAEKDPCQPRTLTLMGGPVDVRESPTVVNKLATTRPLSWFQTNVISNVPARYAGGGRQVYPGFLQLTAFMSMNQRRHIDQHWKLFDSYVAADAAEAAKIKDFYDEYFAVLDLPAEFYIETVDIVFQRALLAKGELTHRGKPVRPDLIHRTALLTVEGERDDICAVGQTSAAHALCSSLRPHMKRHHLQPGVGHYGVFSGKKWQTQVYPQVRNLILAMA
jgi:poly(3-hydroxybutyrate) depolymerase